LKKKSKNKNGLTVFLSFTYFLMRLQTRTKRNTKEIKTHWKILQKREMIGARTLQMMTTVTVMIMMTMIGETETQPMQEY